LDGVAALLALLLAFAAVPAIRADVVYGAAVGYGSDPTEDRPGRLEAYEEAANLDPREPLYALRAGDLRSSRAKTQLDARTEHLRAAHEHYLRAVRLAPLDPRARIGLAQALADDGEAEAARLQIRHSVVLGPRWAGVLARALLMHLEDWESDGDTAQLVDAMRMVSAIAELGTDWGRVLCARRLTASTRDVQGDLLEALARHPDLMREAALCVQKSDPGLAQLLRDVAGPYGAGPDGETDE
jgi:tetratricopeptide (TPR) repeat protein